MRAYFRTSRRTGVSMPFWLAAIVGSVWLVLWLAVLFYGLIAMALMLALRAGVRAWRRGRSRSPGGPAA